MRQKFDCGWGFAPVPAGGAFTTLPQNPDSLAWMVKGEREGNDQGWGSKKKKSKRGDEREEGLTFILLMHSWNRAADWLSMSMMETLDYSVNGTV